MQIPLGDKLFEISSSSGATSPNMALAAMMRSYCFFSARNSIQSALSKIV